MAEQDKNSIHQAKADLLQLKDELRVKLHLAKKDAQQAWHELEPAIGKLEKKLDAAADVVGDASEKARLQAHLGLAEVKAQWPGLEKAIEQVVGDVKKGAEDLKTEVDWARVRSHLAQMDAATVAESKAKDASAELKKAGAEFQVEIEKAVGEIKGSFLALKKKITG